MDIAISVKQGSSASRNNFSGHFYDTVWIKFHLLLLGINRHFVILVDISASQTDILNNYKVWAPDPSILGISPV